MASLEGTTLDHKIRDAESLLAEIVQDFRPAALASSLGAEDMVLTDLILSRELDVDIFTLDTGRLHNETLGLIQTVRERYGRAIEVYFPDRAEVERYAREHGPNAFYSSIDLREACCDIRKMAPLKRALKDKRAWITGLRRQQSITRRGLAVREWDAGNGIEKFNPLADWSTREVWAYIKRFDVPYNPLHDQGFASIGCAPCTRANAAGEDIRAGRWWWEHAESRECGLHLKMEPAP